MKREHLFARIPPPRSSRIGITEQDIARVQVVPELVDEILQCLQSDDDTDVGFGFYFAEHLQRRPEFMALIGRVLPQLLPLIRSRINHQIPQVREAAMGAFVAFRQDFPDYAAQMRELLKSADSIVRCVALRAAPTFISAKQLNVLLPFREDPEFGETGGMGGPLRYYKRDEALEIAERIAGRKFDCGDCFEQRDGQRISWRGWSAFINWLESKKGWGLFGLLSLAVFSLACGSVHAADVPKNPQIVGDWWQVTGDPDLGALTSPNQQPVDFGIWQAADGMWQLWSCIRGTKEHGHTRLLYRWEGARLTDANWKPMGIAMRADPKTGEQEGGLQAPFVFREGTNFVMFYGGWNDICSAVSMDGKSFARRTNAGGKVTLFGAATGNTRDPMVIRIGERWHCYYTAHPNNHGAVYCRTSPDLKAWSEAHLVAKGGQSGDGPWSSECPFVVELEPGQFYLFRNQVYGKGAKCSVYFSRNPLDFGVDHDEGHFVCTLPVAAPEIIKREGQYYIATLLPSLKGIQIAKLRWE